METIVSVSAHCKNFPARVDIKYFAALFQSSAYPLAIMISPEMKFYFYETRLQTVHDSLSHNMVLNSAKKSKSSKGLILVFPFKYNF